MGASLETERRVRILFEWMIEGHNRNDIVTQAVNKWGVSTRQVDRYIVMVKKLFREKSKEEIEPLRGQHIEARQKLLRELPDKNKPAGARVALRILDSIAQLQGLTTDEINVSVAIPPLFPDAPNEPAK